MLEPYIDDTKPHDLRLKIKNPDDTAAGYDVIDPAGGHHLTSKKNMTDDGVRLGDPQQPFEVGVAALHGVVETVKYPTPPPPSLSVVQSIKVGDVIKSPIVWTAQPSGQVDLIDFYIDGVKRWTEHFSPYIFNGDGASFDPTTVTDNLMHEFKVVAAGPAGTAESAVTVLVDVPDQPPPPAGGSAGRVSTVFKTDSSIDYITNNPTQAQKQHFKDHINVIYAYAGYWDSRLSWGPQAVFYKDAYADYKSGSNPSHPEFVLKDKDGHYLFIPWGCGGGTCPQFACDIGDPAFRKFWIDNAITTLNKGYMGIYVDDVNLDKISVGNGSGALVTPWNKRTNSLYTLPVWQEDFATFMGELAARVPVGKLIFHNQLWWARGAAVDKEIKYSTAVALERGWMDPNYSAQSFKDLLAWCDKVHSWGIGLYHQSYAGDKTGTETNLALSLIASNGHDFVGSNWGMKPPGVDEGWWPVYDTDGGDGPSRVYDSTKGLYRREFQKCIALFLEPGKPSVTVDGVTLSARTGRVIAK